MINVLNGTSHKDRIKTDISEKEKRIIACWIDLSAPHAGTYNSYMSLSDSIRYENLLEKRLKWQEIEAEGINEMVRIHGDIFSNTHEEVRNGHTSAEQISIGYMQQSRTFVVNTPCKGKITIVDLRGRVAYKVAVSDRHTGNEMSIPLPASLSRGVYVAIYEGVSGIEMTKISVAK